MKTECPFCKQPYEIEAEHFDRHLQCSTCNRTFICSILTTPVLGTMYLDIETTADPTKSYAEISCIVWWCNQTWYSWVNGKNNPEEFLLFWRNAPQIVTFNGKAFDEPKICKQFETNPHRNHIDLFHEAKKQGLTGGLKEIGETFGFPRPAELDKVDGAIAVKLWKRFKFYGNTEALQNLLYYNAWDVALTYYLHCRFTAAQSEAIHNTIPFTLDANYMATVIPKPRQPSVPRKAVGKIHEFWEERKRNPITVISGVEICITGDLVRIDREDAEALIENLGGSAKKSATRTLDFLVVGNTGEFGRTGKMEQTEKNIAEGAHTKIIDEDEFWKIVEKTQPKNGVYFFNRRG